MVALIPKPNKNATLIKNLRPIAVLPLIYKWYSRCLGLLFQEELQNVSVFQTAFTPGRQAEEVIFTIRSVGGEEQRVEKGYLALRTGHRHCKSL